MKKNRITALYCRISREDEMTDVSSSIETQKTYLKRYANQNKYENIKFYIDDGHSGTNFERPGFISLKEDIENDQIGIVITKDLSRLGRDYLTTGYYIEHYFPLHNIRYIAINDQVDTDKNDNDFAPFRNIMNEWYARDISKKIRSAYKTKALNGDFTGPYPPYGYSRDSKNKHKLVIKERQSVMVLVVNITPVVYIDPSGDFFLLTLAITTFAGALMGFSYTFVKEMISNDFDVDKLDWKEIWVNTITGAAMGSAYGLGAGAGIIIRGSATLFSLTTAQSLIVLGSTAGMINFAAGALSYNIRHKGQSDYSIGKMMSSAFGQMGKGLTVFGVGTLMSITGLWKPMDFGNMLARVLAKQVITFLPVYIFDNLYKY